MVPLTKLPSHLPDLCLENIFKRVPLFDLLRSVRVVCPNWRRVVPTELRRRRELVLVGHYKRDMKMIRDYENSFRSDLIEQVRRDDGQPWLRLRSLDQIRFDVLLVPGGVLTEAFASSLMDTLPGITHLTVVQNDAFNKPIRPNKQTDIPIIVRLLNHYRDRLFSLKLDICYVSSNDSSHELVTNCTALIDTINQLQSLGHLTLNAHFSQISLTDLPSLSILSQLDTFTSNHQLYNSPWHLDSVRQHATVGRVRIDWQPNSSLDTILGLDPQVASKFTSVNVRDDLLMAHYDEMLLFGTRFSSISCLTLILLTMPLSMLTRCLSPLTELIHLKVETARRPRDQLLDPVFVPLPSVRLLSLTLYTRAHYHLEQFHLAEIFPNLQVLSLSQRINDCHLCEYDDVTGRDVEELDAEILHRIEQCISLSRQPFRDCAHLHTIKHQEINGMGYFTDLFPRNLITRDQL